ncbi:unnamed protein product [Prorocentrum cordatum]|uniref:Sulfotransferase n=1 Tax=Prorocentrum cordatum TaxID=2364126 RepID=A0ABN9X999_9DINO|nr:unnamed protein product [Polarella glacialis]
MTDVGAPELERTALTHDGGNVRFRWSIVGATLGVVVACVMAGAAVGAHAIFSPRAWQGMRFPSGPQGPMSEGSSEPLRERHPNLVPARAPPRRGSHRRVGRAQSRRPWNRKLYAKHRGSHAATNAAAQTFLQSPLPPKVANISVERPLVFIHQRKAGGISLRSILFSQAKRLHLPFNIKCFSEPCESYSYGTSKVAVYGGHVDWLELSRTFARQGQFTSKDVWKDGVQQFSCITNFRDPLSRIQSCYYYRFKKFGAPDCLAAVKPEDMKQFFRQGRSEYGLGCLNEPFRMLSGLVDEALFNDDTDDQEWDYVFNSTLANLAHCVPIILENCSTLDVAVSWFPQLKHIADLRTVRKNRGGEKCELSQRHLDVLEDLTRHERNLYDLAVQRADKFFSSMPPP